MDLKHAHLSRIRFSGVDHYNVARLADRVGGLVDSSGISYFLREPRTTTCIDLSLLASRYSCWRRSGSSRARRARDSHVKRVVDERLRERPFHVRRVTWTARVAPIADHVRRPAGFDQRVLVKRQGRLALNSRFTTLFASLSWTALDGIR